MLIQNPHLEGNAFTWEGGPTGVLLIHGFTATSAEIRPLGRVLHEHGYTVAGPLLPGHFTRPEDLNRVRWQDWVATAEAAYAQIACRCTRVIVGGESTGGLLTLYLASEHPEIAAVMAYAPALRLNFRLIDYLKLYLAAPFIPYIAHSASPLAAKKARPGSTGSAATGEDAAGDPGSDGQNPSDMLWQGYTVRPLKGAIQLLRLQKQIYPRLARIQQPVLVVQGRLDSTVHPSVPETILTRVRSSLKEVHWMEKSAHTVVLDRELDQVAAITLEFMERALK